jgi:hypothetical protein
MRDGQSHELVAESEAAACEADVRYRCIRCGEGYRVRTSAPSCRIALLEQMEELQAPYMHLQSAARRALLDTLVRRRFKWPRPVREAMLEKFERWHSWKAITGSQNGRE